VDFAGRVVRIACSNSDRIMKDHKVRRKQETDLLTQESPQIWREYVDQMVKMRIEVELEAMMMVSEARSKG
jgi:hypothetical protein